MRPVVLVVAATLVVSSTAGVVSTSGTAPVSTASAAPEPVAVVSQRPDLVSAGLAARRQGSRVKVASAGSAESETFANPDGSVSTEAYAEPAFRRDGARRDGDRWVPLSAAVSGSGTAADPVVAAGLPWPVTVGRSSARLIEAALPGGSVAFGTSALQLRSPARSGSTVTFPDAAVDTDAELVVGPSGVKTNLVLRSAAAPRSFRFHVSDPAGVLGTPGEQPDGSWLFSAELGDGYRLALAPATAYVPAEVETADLGWHGVDRSSASQAVSRADDGWDVVVSVDAQWLAGKSFPVVLDPSPTFVAGTFGVMDCHLVNGSYATTNFCGSASAVRDAGTWSSLVRRTLLRFDTSSIPTTAVVSAATLDLSLSQALGASVPMGVRAYRVTSGWLNSATWNSNGAVPWSGGNYDSSVLLASTQVGPAAGHYTWAVSPAAVQSWVNGSVSNYGLLLRTVDESVTGAFRFASGAAADPTTRPKMTITYNTPPTVPGGRMTTPCAAACGQDGFVSSVRPTLSGTAEELDAEPLRHDFEVYAGHGTPTTLVTSGSVPDVASMSAASWVVPAGVLTGGGQYQWRQRAFDGTAYGPWTSTFVRFTVDTTLPATPTVSSATYTNNVWSASTSGTISWSSSDANGPVLFSSKLDGEQWHDWGSVTARPLSGLAEGLHTMSVRAQDKAGNVSATSTLSFGVGSGGIGSPPPEQVTQARVTLGGVAPAGRDWLTWTYRAGSTGAFGTIPTTALTLPGTSTNPTFPMGRDPGSTATPKAFGALVWDVAATVPADGLVQVQACYGTSASDPAPACGNAPRQFQLTRAGFDSAYATEEVGPGTVSLLTGDFQLSDTDVDVPTYSGSLSHGRTLTTLAPSTVTTGATGIFGPGWVASLPAPEGGAAGSIFSDATAAQGYVTLTGEDGSQDVYSQASATTYAGVGDADDGSVLTKDSATQYTLAELDGTKTTWAKTAAGWGPTQVVEAGTAAENTTRYTRDPATGRVTTVLGPVPPGVSCATTDTKGCRSLELTYATTTTATGADPTQWGDYTGRLTSVAFRAYDPDVPASNTVLVPVARYSYDSAGLLRAQWDPRISPALKTTYSYGTGNRLATVTPPGLAAWSLGYDGANRLVTASRPDPSGATAVSTVRYGVPSTGAGAPVDLSGTVTAGWGQGDLPTVGAAVWGPEQVPAATPSTDDWQFASLTYLNVSGRPVNTASHGAGAWQVDVTEYDHSGNTIRTLSAGNRAQALTPTAATDPYVAAQPSSVERARLLSEVSVYDAQGVELLDTYGPMHPVVLEDGSTVSARAHTHTDYDQNAPGAGGPFHLPTTETTTAQTPDGVDHDPDVTTTGYDPVVAGDGSGWDLKTATTTTVDPGASPHLNQLTTTRSDAAGKTIETRPPADPAGTGPTTTVTTHYTAGGAGTCGAKPHWAGLVCQTAPKAQPGTGNPLPVTTTTYTMWDAAKTVTETAGTTTRTAISTFDGAGRPTGQTVAVTPAAAGGTPIPDTTLGYDPATGLATTTTSSSGGSPTGSITLGHDTLGRPTSYTQRDGAGTVLTAAATAYDLAGRIATRSDGKGTTTYTYETSTEHRGLVTSTSDTGVGTFTAGYDPDGKTTAIGYPGGLTAATSHDNTGNPTQLTYTKSGTNWLTFTQVESGDGQTRRQTSPASRQTFGYDPADRLTRVDDTTAGVCTRRQYTFSTATNRTALATTPATPTADGDCDLTGAATTNTTHTYDSADRTTDPGYTIDTLGRTTTLPATGGTAAVTAGYYANDMAQSLTQSGRTRAYTLDPTGNRIWSITDTAGPTLTNHYTDGGDSPAWTETGTTGAFTRYLPDPDGGLAATITHTSTIELQLANLHGDLVATATPTDTTPTTYTETTEYGQPRNPTTARYGWLGTHQRATDTIAGLTLMGVRLYNPTTGRFLSIDPIPGGSANDYDYCNADPINCTDLDGRWPCFRCAGKSAGRWAWRNRGNIVGAGLTFVPIAGQVAWAYRGYKTYKAVRGSYNAYRASRLANRALSATRIGGRGIGFGQYRLALHAPHNWYKRFSRKAPQHAGRFHLHTGKQRTTRYVFRFWKRMT